MSFSDLLINRCDIHRWADGGPDLYGNPTKEWDEHYIEDEPCRISYPRGRQVMRNTEVIPVEAVLFMEYNDVTEYDKAVVDGDAFEILFVASLADGLPNHHLELSLIRVKP